MFDLTSSVVIDPDDVLTVADAKKHLEIVEADWDAILSAYIKSAINMVERYSKTRLIEREFTWKLDCFEPILRFPIVPVGEISDIKYFDSAGVEQTLAGTEWVQSLGRVAPANGKSWPSTDGRIGAISIRFPGGYTGVADQEPLLVAAVRLTVGDLFENRESSTRRSAPDMPMTAKNLCDLVRTPTL